VGKADLDCAPVTIPLQPATPHQPRPTSIPRAVWSTRARRRPARVISGLSGLSQTRANWPKSVIARTFGFSYGFFRQVNTVTWPPGWLITRSPSENPVGHCRPAGPVSPFGPGDPGGPGSPRGPVGPVATL